MFLEQLLAAYGYPVILFGTFLEGETILVLGGIAAHLGYLQLPWVIFAAFIGTLAGDQLFFFLGRHYGPSLLKHRPAWQKQASRVQRLMDRHHTAIILGFRFLYGLRTITPFVIGMSRIPTSRFLLLNILSALIWSMVFGVLGYAFGYAVEILLGEVKRYELELMASVATVGIVVWAIYLWRRSRD